MSTVLVRYGAVPYPPPRHQRRHLDGSLIRSRNAGGIIVAAHPNASCRTSRLNCILFRDLVARYSFQNAAGPAAEPASEPRCDAESSSRPLNALNAHTDGKNFTISSHPPPRLHDFQRSSDVESKYYRAAGTNFPLAARDAFGLRGLLPPVVESSKQQVERVMLQLRGKGHATPG